MVPGRAPPKGAPPRRDNLGVARGRRKVRRVDRADQVAGPGRRIWHQNRWILIHLPTMRNTRNQGVGRVSTLFRLFLIIPSRIVDGLLAGMTTLPLVSLLRKKYPRWWFDFNLERPRFSARVGAYSALVTDQYQSTDEAHGVSRLSGFRSSLPASTLAPCSARWSAPGVGPGA